jgi:hypothetical protein
MSSRSADPGPEELRELSKEDARAARDDLRESVAADDAEEDDGEPTDEEILELDQTELEELGLTLDDPHQPDDD